MFDPNLANGNSLAYVGDSVMSLMVREYLVKKGITKSKQLQELSTNYVSANAQAKLALTLLERSWFTEREVEIYHLGRNYKSATKAKNTDVQTYRIASGFEAVWGYLHLNDNQQRICELWDACRTIVEEESC